MFTNVGTVICSRVPVVVVAKLLNLLRRRFLMEAGFHGREKDWRMLVADVHAHWIHLCLESDQPSTYQAEWRTCLVRFQSAVSAALCTRQEGTQTNSGTPNHG